MHTCMYVIERGRKEWVERELLCWKSQRDCSQVKGLTEWEERKSEALHGKPVITIRPSFKESRLFCPYRKLSTERYSFFFSFVFYKSQTVSINTGGSCKIWWDSSHRRQTCDVWSFHEQHWCSSIPHTAYVYHARQRHCLVPGATRNWDSAHHCQGELPELTGEAHQLIWV